MEATKHKDPKVAAASLETIVLSVEQFGAKELPTSSLLKTLPRFFEHKDKNVSVMQLLLVILFCGLMRRAYRCAPALLRWQWNCINGWGI